jgi:hypothetical protein
MSAQSNSAKPETPTFPADAGATPFLLTVRGKPVASSTEEARTTHNATAGAPQSVAGAQSLGDLSHNVFIGLADSTGEILFIDIWNSLGGLGQFFADSHVQAAAGQLFAERDGVVWAPAAGFGSVYLPLPSGKSVGNVGILRATVSSVEKAAAAFSAYSAETLNRARTHGLVSHTSWLRVANPGEEQSTEILGVDSWTDAAQMNAFYDLGLGVDHLGTVLTSAPATSIWESAPGHWAEW